MKINGNIQFHTLGSGELQNAIMERVASNPATTVAGRLVYNTTDNLYYFHNGTSWIAFATGGDATSLQTEVNAIETASGGLFAQADGTWDATSLSGTTNISGATSLANALVLLDSAIEGADALSELTDTTLSALADNDLLQYNSTGSIWENKAIGSASGVQAFGEVLDDLNTLGAAGSADQMIYSTGAGAFAYTTITAAGRALLDDASALAMTQTLSVEVGVDVQAYDADLTALAGLTHTGGEVIYSNAGTWAAAAPGATSGVQAYDAGLVSLAGLAASANDIIIATGTDAYTTFATGTVGRNILADATAADVRTEIGVYSTTEADNAFVDVAGDTMTGNLTMQAGTAIIINDAPTLGTHAVNKNYADNLVAGLTWKNSVVAASTANVDLTGGTPTTTLDGIALTDGDRVLIMNQTAPAENGIYTFATGGVYTRGTDMDSLTPIDEVNGAAVYVEQGATYGDAGYTVTSQVTTLGTDAVTWTQFNGASAITAGIGLAKTGNTLSVNLGAGIVELPTDEVGIDLYDAATGALILTTDGSTRGTATGDKLYLLLDSTTLTQSASGLKVASQGITATEIHTDVAGDGLAGGNGTNLSVNVDNASGVVISSDAVALSAVPNSSLANSTITMSDGSATDAVALGETLTFAGDSYLTPAVTANTVTYTWAANIADLGDVDDTGRATDNILAWNGTNWVAVDVSTVLDQAVLSDLSDVVTSGEADYHALVWDDTNSQWVNKAVYYLYSGASATSHTVTHSLGQQYCNVTVVDASDEVIIPQSITFNSATQLTVTFNTAIACKVVVMGVPAI